MNWTNATQDILDSVTTGEIVYYIFQMILAFSIIVVNAGVVYTLIITESLHSPTNWIFGSQAMADIMLGMIRPYQGLLEIGVSRLANACIAASSLSVATGSISMEHLTLVSLDRYIMITQPLRYNNLITLRRMQFATTIIWIVIILMSSFSIMGVRRPDFTDDSYCSADTFMPLWYLLLMIGVTFIIPCNILILAYYKIFKIAYNHNKQIAQERQSNSDATSDLKLGLRSAKLFATLAGVFLVCWTPYFIVRIIHVVSGVTPTSVKWDYVSVNFGVLNSLVNPLLYAFRQPDIRREIAKRLPCFRRNASQERRPTQIVASIQTQSTATY